MRDHPLVGMPIHPCRRLARRGAGAVDIRRFEGIVRDSTGGGLPGATLVLTNVETGVERTLGDQRRTGATGFRPCRPASTSSRCRSTASPRCSAPASCWRSGQVATVDIALPLGGVTQKVTVTRPRRSSRRGAPRPAPWSRDGDREPADQRPQLPRASRRTVAGVTGQQMSGQGSGISFNGQRGAQQQHLGGRRGQQRPAQRQHAPDHQPGGGARVPGGHQPVRAGVRPRRGRAGQHRLALGHQRVPRQRVFYFVRDESMDARNAFVTEAREAAVPAAELSAARSAGRSIAQQDLLLRRLRAHARDESDVVTISDADVAAINADAGRPPDSRRAASRRSPTASSRSTHRRHARLAQARPHAATPTTRSAFRYIYGKSVEANAGGVAHRRPDGRVRRRRQRDTRPVVRWPAGRTSSRRPC